MFTSAAAQMLLQRSSWQKTDRRICRLIIGIRLVNGARRQGEGLELLFLTAAG